MATVVNRLKLIRIIIGSVMLCMLLITYSKLIMSPMTALIPTNCYTEEEEVYAYTTTANESAGANNNSIANDSLKEKLPSPLLLPKEDLSFLDGCKCETPKSWHAQAGQDRYLFDRLFFQQGLCCKGTFVEFGGRNGIEHSNTYSFEKYMGWKGLMFEVDPVEYPNLQKNRPKSKVFHGPVCPSYQSNITISFSRLGGWTGALDSYEPSRLNQERSHSTFQCYHLANVLRNNSMHRVDYMTIDTEGSEVSIVEDFPWDDFDIRVVQIEQLVAGRYPAQKGKKEKVIAHMEKFGYKLLSVYVVAISDTDDLTFVRNLDPYLPLTSSTKDTLKLS